MIKINIRSQIGYEIALRHYEPESDFDTVVLIIPANGVKQSFYASFANYLFSQNVAAFTFDYGGIGDSKKEDLPKSAALQWRNWCLSPNYLFDHIEDMQSYYDKIKCPLVSYSTENDVFAPKEAIDWLTK